MKTIFKVRQIVFRMAKLGNIFGEHVKCDMLANNVVLFRHKINYNNCGNFKESSLVWTREILIPNR